MLKTISTAANAINKAHQGHFSKLLVAGINRPSPIFLVAVAKDHLHKEGLAIENNSLASPSMTG